MFKFLKKPLSIIFIVIVVLVVVILVATGGSKDADKYDYSVAERGDVIQQVTVTGRIEPAEDADLAFEGSGTVSSIHVSVGDEVYAGQSLVRLSAFDLYAQLEETQASLTAEEAGLAELQRGAREEEISVYEAALAQVEQTLQNDYDNIRSKLTDAYAKADDAVRAKTSGIFSGSSASFFKLTYDPCDANAENEASFLRLLAEQELNDWQAEISGLNTITSREELDQVLVNGVAHLQFFSDFLHATNTTLTTGCVIGDSSLGTYRTNIGTARTNVSTALTNITAHQQTIAYDKVSVQKEQSDLNEVLAGSSKEEIIVQEAAVKQAQAKVSNIRAQIGKTILSAPFSGIIARQDARLGEFVSTGDVLVTVISGLDFLIKADIPEVDIAKVKVGDPAEVTMDAYGGGEVFLATVTAINPAETIIEGIAAYETTLEFNEEDERIKSGMTANLEIKTDSREDVIVIPQRAVVRENNDKYVRVLRDGEVVKMSVVTGLRGSTGTIEITDGINEGDKVIVFIKGK